MSKLERLIGEWRATANGTAGVTPETLDELEHHLRETMVPLLASGLNESEAFERAVRQLGTAPALAAEFQKLRPATWLPVKVVAGLAVMAALALSGLLSAHYHDDRWSWLMMGNVVGITLGYVTALLTGMLGFCFVGQTWRRTFPNANLHYIRRAIASLTAVAALLTAAGMILGMFWLKANQGHWWNWESKETMGFGVTIWLVGTWLAAWRSWVGTRALLTSSIAGNLLVLVAWFGPFLMRTGHSSALGSNFAMALLAVGVVHLAFLVAGLGSMDRLQSGRA